MRVIEIEPDYVSKWESLREFLESRPTIQIKGVVDDGVVRAIILHDEVRIYHVYTNKDSRNSGMAKLLISYVSNIYHKNVITAVVERDNMHAVRAFLENGYLITGFNVTWGDNRYVMQRNVKHPKASPDPFREVNNEIESMIEHMFVVEVLPQHTL